MKCVVATLLVLAATPVLGHTGAFARGMYCRNGASNVDSPNTNTVVNPLYGLAKKDWWMQADRGCPNYPPPAGEYLDLPVGKTFTVELAFNRAFTTLSYDGKSTSDWPDGKDHPEDWNGFTEDPGEGCIQGAGGALHVQNQGNATGTAFAISYNSDLSKVTMENLVVFTVAEHTPWKRLTTYQIPKDLPPCPEGGCHCTYGWAPNGCGQRNVYLQPFKCNVVGSTSTKQLSEAKSPVYCKDDATKCTKGAKQVIIFAQLEGNNVTPLPGKSPGYNSAWGFAPGAQNDIFTDATIAPSAISSASLSAISSAAVLPSASVVASMSANATYSSAHSTASYVPSNSSVYSPILSVPTASISHFASTSASSLDLFESESACEFEPEPSAPADVSASVATSPMLNAASSYSPYPSAAISSNAAKGANLLSSQPATFASIAVSSSAVKVASLPYSTFITYASASSASSSSVVDMASPVPSVKKPRQSHRPRPPLPDSQDAQGELQNFFNFIDAAWARWQQGHGGSG